MKNKLPTIIRDTREKPDHGFKFIASKNCEGMIVEKLDFGDYALKGYPEVICIERKASVLELCTNLGKERARFERELQRMVDANVRWRFVIVEDYWSSTTKRQRFSKMPPDVVFESIIALMLKYDVQFIFAGNHKQAHRIARSLLIKAYKYHLEGLNE